MSIQVAVPLTRVMYLNDVHGFSDESSSKAFMAGTLPAEIKGVTPTAAVLYVYQTNASSSGVTDVAAKSSVAAWTLADSVVSMEALTLSAALSTQNIPNTADAWRTWDVLGSVSIGMREACEQSRTEITFALHKTGYPTSEFTNPNYIQIGSEDDSSVSVFAPSGANAPYVLVTIPDSRIPIHSGLGGGGPMF